MKDDEKKDDDKKGDDKKDGAKKEKLPTKSLGFFEKETDPPVMSCN